MKSLRPDKSQRSKGRSARRARRPRLLSFTGISGLIGAASLLGASSLAHAAALDTITFGDTTSESAHAFSTSGTGTVVSPTTGGMGLTCRRVNPNNFINFTMTVDPTQNNYLTIKFWGSDTNANTLYLYKTGSTITTSLPIANHYGSYNNYNDGKYVNLLPPIYLNGTNTGTSEPGFPGRFFYVTFLIPPDLINTTTRTATIRLGEVGVLAPYASSAANTEVAATSSSCGIYKAYTTTDGYFVPDSIDMQSQGTAPATFSSVSPQSVSTLVANQKTTLDAAVGPGSTVGTLASWVSYGSTWTSKGLGALIGSIYAGSLFHGASASSPPTLTKIATEVSANNLVHLRIPSAIAKAYTSPWSAHYHDTDYLGRIVAALDFCCLMQGSNGGLSGGGSSNNTWVGVIPPGLPSTVITPATSSSTVRSAGGSVLEGYGSQGLGLAFNLLWNDPDPTAHNLLLGYLNATIQSDGVNAIPRSVAWETLLNNNVQYLIQNRGHASNQDMAQITALYLENQAAQTLDSYNASLPGGFVGQAAVSTTPVLANNPLSAPAVMQYVYSAVGLTPSALGTTATTTLITDPSFAGYWLSPLGMPLEPWGTLGGGYDGNYGMDNCINELCYLAEITGDPFVQLQALKAVHVGTYFFTPSYDASGNPVMRKEEQISTRNLEWPGRVAYNSNDYAADPSGLNDPEALRAEQLGYLQGETLSLPANSDAHYTDDVTDALLRVDHYNNALNAPMTDYRLPTESGQPDFAWADPLAQTVAIQRGTERLYIALNWRRGFTSTSPGSRDGNHTQVSNIARIHYTTSTIDRTATVGMLTPMPNPNNTTSGFGQLYSVAYGPYFVALNPSSTTNYPCTVPSAMWGKVVLDLYHKTAVTVPANGVINVPILDSAVYYLPQQAKVTAGTITFSRDSGTNAVLATVTLVNSGTGTATNIQINSAVLGGQASLTGLPLSVADIPAGATGTVTLTFPSTLVSGTNTSLSLSGTYSDGSFSGASRARIP